MPARVVLISVPALASLVLGFVWYWKYSRTKANNDQISIKNKEGDDETATKTKVSKLTAETGVSKRDNATEEKRSCLQQIWRKVPVLQIQILSAYSQSHA
jgi:hypothetical protein